MSRVISASRRTDIPAFYSEWFKNRLKAGHVFVQHPFTGRFSRVSLRPEDVSALVFWSKNYQPLLDKLEIVEQTTRNFLFHFTITANRDLESGTPDYKDAIRDYRYLVARYSPEQLVWRFDPICVTDKLSFEAHEERFVRCAELLKGRTRRCTISFVHPYKKALINLKKYSGHSLLELTLEKKREYAHRLAQRAGRYGIQLLACCNDYLVSEQVGKARCIDGQQLSRIFNAPIDARAAASRKECACAKSTDIGAYDTCAHGCVYCYATTDRLRASAALMRHDPEWNSLARQVASAETGPAGEQKAFTY